VNWLFAETAEGLVLLALSVGLSPQNPLRKFFEFQRYSADIKFYCHFKLLLGARVASALSVFGLHASEHNSAPFGTALVAVFVDERRCVRALDPVGAAVRLGAA
jgi:hypothetical protein